MTLLYRLRALVRWLFRRDEIERAIDTDLKDYIERSAAEKVRAGMSEAEARRAARIELGGVEQTKENVRVRLSFAVIDNTLADIGYAQNAAPAKIVHDRGRVDCWLRGMPRGPIRLRRCAMSS